MTSTSSTAKSFLAAACLSLLTLQASAQTDEERAGARAQALAGVEAFDAGRYQEALDLFTRAESVVHSPVHLFYIAQAQVKLGRLVQAQEALVKVTGDPQTGPEAFARAQKDAEALLEQLQPRIPQLRIVVEGAGQDPVSVTMDGQAVPPGLVGVARPVNPGEHKVIASAPGLAGEALVTLQEGQAQTVTVQLVPAATAPAAAPAAGPPGEDQGTSGGSDKSGLRIGSYVAFGVGVVGLGVGTVFALQFGSKQDDADKLNDECRPRGCTPDEQGDIKQLDDDANSAGTLATVGFIAGGVGIAAGVTLFVLSMDGDKEAAARAPVLPYLGARTVGVQGAF